MATGVQEEGEALEPSLTKPADPLEALKQQAALEAVQRVHDGMRLGLGTGSTSRYAVEAIGALVQSGALRSIVAVPTSEKTAELARKLGIPLVELEAAGKLDLAIDGADEIDPDGNLIKGGGGAMLRERAVEERAQRLIIIADHTKLSPKLGLKFALPVEIERTAWRGVDEFLATFGAVSTLRGGEGNPFVTDNGNVILDARFSTGIDAPHELARALDGNSLVRAHGLFLDMASEVIVASPSGVRVSSLR